MPCVKGIFFDAAGVFYDRTVSTGTFAKSLLREQGFSVELTEEQSARKKGWRVLATEGRIGHEEYWERILRMHGVADQDKLDGLKKRILDHTDDVYAYPGAATTLAELKARGFVLGIVTNTIYPVEWKMTWLAKVGVAKYIDVVSCSTVLGAHKPEPEMYLNALKQAQLTPPEAAFVGHDAEELEGAHKAGLTTVAVNYDPQAQSDYYCNSLSALLDVPVFQKEGAVLV